ncbi:MAG: glutaredoxin domain-containing protein [Rikenellaceae bacterium]
MKTLKIFYLKNCPFCKKAFAYLEELKAENPQFATIQIETIEESEEAAIADSYDYYYVPTIYADEVKVHEAGITKDEMKSILEAAL